MIRSIFSILALAALPLVGNASLVGTEVSLRTLGQANPTSTPFITSFERTVIVSPSIVEYPDVASLSNPGNGAPPGFGSLVDVAIDIGADFITIDFDNSAPQTRFASAFENTYIFRFASSALVDIVGASIDSAVTTLGLDASDIRFVGNELFVNVESLSFNPSTFARINLEVVGGPLTVPEPGSITLVLLALGMVAARVGVNRRGPTRQVAVA